MMVQGHEVVGIREQRVFLRPTGRALCHASMFTPRRVAQPTAIASEERQPAQQSSLRKDELDAGILQVSDTRYTVSRQLFDKLLGAPSQLMRIARAMPHEENGRLLGVKVSGIRPATLLDKLGVQNGDVLRSINGFDLSSPDSVLEAYTKLRSLNHLSLALIRRGQSRTMEYQVQ
jgi:general secretion pathway protein C